MHTTTLSKPKLLKAVGLCKILKHQLPKTKTDLKNYIKYYLELDVSDKKICSCHDSPLDYLWHSFVGADLRVCPKGEHIGSPLQSTDCIVWAGRGGGKTYLAAVATLLDSIFKPGCKTRILAGSETQAMRMYDYLIGFLNSGFEDFLAQSPLKNKCCFANDSDVEVLTQSMASIRGSHIQKLRCDEIELFKRQNFEAAKFIVKSDKGIVGAMESLSTMHQPFGIMHELVNKAKDNGTKIFKWCIWEVIENCPPDRSCSTCPLNSDCGGKARKANGYLKIDDCIAQMRRSSRAAFESEMLCLRPSLENVVFAEFQPRIHIAPVEYNPDLPLYRTIDFGFVNPFVCLWIQVDADDKILILDEYIQSRKTIDAHAVELKNRKPFNEKKVTATFCDPAGVGVNDVTGTSPVSQLRQAGIRVHYRSSSILDGIELIRRALRTGDSESHLVINPRCQKLIEAMQCYHYPQSGSLEMPQKDGIYDHPMDALRYFFVNLNSSNPAKNRRY